MISLLAETTQPAALNVAKWIPTLPLLSMILCGLLCFVKSESVRKATAWITIAAVAGAFLASVSTVLGLNAIAADTHEYEVVVHFFDWINIGQFSGDFSFYIDPLTSTMLMVVTGIGTLITIYAAGYMAGDEGYARFFTYISLFIFAMTCLVLADNLLLLYLGWEGVGAASYFLIGYYYRKPSAVAAAKKAFIVNRVGDFGFALGLMATYMAFGSIQFDVILPAARELFDQATSVGLTQALADSNLKNPSETLILWIPFLLMLGAFGKSAQLPLHVWLPDAMEGPTPVSALIHAATMVTAGVYMISRLIALFMLNPAALTTVAVVGCVTALFAATIALCQNDLKKVWAYSTCSQLGYMFMGVGVLGTTGAIFHLYTHAFFKALLFLTAGSVMHALAGQLNLFKMSGLRHKMPVTCWLMFLGCLALAGLPLTSGNFSKDTILADALVAMPLLGYLGIITALLTAFYTFRLWFRVFCGPLQYEMGNEHHGYVVEHNDHDDDHGHHEPHEMSWLMNGPLVVLAVGAIFAGIVSQGWITDNIHHSTAGVDHATVAAFYDMELQEYEDKHHAAHSLASWVAGGGAILMIALAAYFHLFNRAKADRISKNFAPLVVIMHNKYFIDELYDAIIRKPLRGLGSISSGLDSSVLDRGIIDKLIGWAPARLVAAIAGLLQRGPLQSYATSMALGLVIILIFYTWKAVS